MMSTIFILLLLFFTIYNYTVPIGDGNDTIIMHYDEPVDDNNNGDDQQKSKHHITEKEWQEMEEEDEKEHARESKAWDEGNYD